MCGTISPLPQYDFMAWCLVKHRGNFTLGRQTVKTGRWMKVSKDRILGDLWFVNFDNCVQTTFFWFASSLVLAVLNYLACVATKKVVRKAVQ
jgi:hypothetical protein